MSSVGKKLAGPLTSLLGYAETLLDEPLESKTREFLEIIRRNAQRMSHLARRPF